MKNKIMASIASLMLLLGILAGVQAMTAPAANAADSCSGWKHTTSQRTQWFSSTKNIHWYSTMEYKSCWTPDALHYFLVNSNDSGYDRTSGFACSSIASFNVNPSGLSDQNTTWNPVARAYNCNGLQFDGFLQQGPAGAPIRIDSNNTTDSCFNVKMVLSKVTGPDDVYVSNDACMVVS